MKTIGIIAEFNPFHNGHKYLIEKCKKDLGADYCVVVMSGDFVQRGAPAITGKYSRAEMALLGGADIVFELPVYYSLGSAEFFAKGAISLLDKLGTIDYLCFGCENPDIDRFNTVCSILADEPLSYKEKLNNFLQDGFSFPTAREKALFSYLENDGVKDISLYKEIMSNPNNILGIEYIKALKQLKSSITPYIIKREGKDYHSIEHEKNTFSSAQGIRQMLLNEKSCDIKEFIPPQAARAFLSYPGKFLDCDDFSEILHYKLLLEKRNGYDKYLDVSYDLSNRIVSMLDKYDGFSSFCEILKTKNLTYSRISRSLMHILLSITDENMNLYKEDNFTVYGRILGMRKEASALLAHIQKRGSLNIISRMKDADKVLSPLQMKLFEENLCSTGIYNLTAKNMSASEYRIKPIII